MGGTGLRDLALLDNGAADHDANAFPDPDRFDITRQAAAYPTFGHEPRYCIGAPLARIELQAFLPAHSAVSRNAPGRAGRTAHRGHRLAHPRPGRASGHLVSAASHQRGRPVRPAGPALPDPGSRRSPMLYPCREPMPYPCEERRKEVGLDGFGLTPAASCRWNGGGRLDRHARATLWRSGGAAWRPRLTDSGSWQRPLSRSR